MTRYEDFPDVMTVVEAAKLLRISSNTAYEMIRQKKIPAIRMGHKLLISKKALMAMMEVG